MTEQAIDFNLIRMKLPGFIANPDPNLYETEKENALVLDFETTTHHKGSAMYDENDLVLACWVYKGVRYHKWGGVYEQSLLVRHCEECSYIVAHNAKFELQWLARCGLDIGTKLVFCTMLAEYVIGGNRYTHSKLSLDNVGFRRLTARKLKVCGLMYKSGQCSRDIPESWLLRYCIKDVDLCQRVWYNQLEELKEKDLLPVLFTRCIATPVLSDIEKNGMYLDESQVQDKARACEEDYRLLTTQLNAVSGGINTNSGPQLSKLLYDDLGFDELQKHGKAVRTPTDLRLTDQGSLLQLKAKTKEQRAFLKVYKAHKAKYNELTKYLRKFSDCCTEAGGRLRAVFNQAATKTHRLSSSGLDYSCQFQNFPRSYKGLFISRNEGWLMGEGDGAQLEFRVAAHLGRDTTALSDIKDKVDIHSFTASVIGCSRQAAKADTFKPLYGGTSGTKKQQAYYAAFKQKYSGIAQAQDQWVNGVLHSSEDVLITEWGLRFYFPGTKLTRGGYVTNSTNICNIPVQSLATAEIIPVALVYAWHYMRALDCEMFIVNTIHDSIICELPPREAGCYKEIMRQCLIHEAGSYLREVYGLTFVAPLGCGIKVDKYWGSGEEETYED